MKKITLEPTLNRCVQDLAKERYWALVNEYTRRIRNEGFLEDMEMEIEALRVFLEEMDVAGYRKETETYLEKGEKVRLVLEVSGQGGVNVKVEHK